MVATNELTRANRVSENGLSSTVEVSAETQQAGAIAMARAEIEGAILIAKRFPRSEDEGRQKILKACRRYGFADTVHYKFPRGTTTVKGLTVYFAREMARCWGNIRWGADIIREDENERQIRCWAWDTESNVKVQSDDVVAKLIQRKNKETGQTTWIVPDERDLRELTNKRAALGVRNCILELIPADIKDEAWDVADATLERKATEDPDGERKKLIAAFESINIPVSELEKYLGHKIAICTPKQLTDLKALGRALHEGATTWAAVMRERSGETATETPKPTGPVSGESLTSGKATSAPKAAPAPQPRPAPGEAFAGLSQGITEASSADSLMAVVERIDRARADGAITADEQQELHSFAQARHGELSGAGLSYLDDLESAIAEAPTVEEVKRLIGPVLRASVECGNITEEGAQRVKNKGEMRIAVLKGGKRK